MLIAITWLTQRSRVTMLSSAVLNVLMEFVCATRYLINLNRDFARIGCAVAPVTFIGTAANMIN